VPIRATAAASASATRAGSTIRSQMTAA